MSALFAANRLLRRLSIVCAMAACVPSGIGANYLPVVGAVAAVALLVSSLAAERVTKSDNNRLHSTYLLASPGFLVALAIWGYSMLGSPSISSPCP
jgi:hypothetical protein